MVRLLSEGVFVIPTQVLAFKKKSRRCSLLFCVSLLLPNNVQRLNTTLPCLRKATSVNFDYFKLPVQMNLPEL